MSLKDKCGACKWHFSQLERDNTLGHYCRCGGYAHHVSVNAKKCANYSPIGFEPEQGKGMCFGDFVEQAKEFYNTMLKPLGYSDLECDDMTCTTRPNPVACYHLEVSRMDPRKKEKVCALMLNYSAGDKKPFMLYENMCSFDYIPAEYGDLRKPEMPEQAPQFVYGYFTRLGDALNSMLKGCSIDLRKPIELYY